MRKSVTPWSVLEPHEMRKIHEQSVELLESTGIAIDHEGFLDVLEAQGAKIDRATRVARIPTTVTEAAAHAVCRNPCFLEDDSARVERMIEEDMRKALGSPLEFRFGGSGLEVLNDDLRTSRKAGFHDFERMIRFGNGHPRISTVGGPPVQYAYELDGTEVPPSLRPIAGMRYAAKHCAKLGWNEISNVDDVRFAVAIGELLAAEADNVDAADGFRENPVFLCVKCSISPLRIGADAASILFELAKRNLPLGIAPMPLAGGTSPVTPASAILITNAEILGGMVAIHAVGSESRQEHLPLSAVMDMQTAVASFSNPNAVLQDTGVAQMWSSFYGVPVHAATDYIDAKYPGYQSGVERGFKVATSLMAGSIYPSVGQLKSGLICSPEQACLDIEAFDWMRHYLRGIEVTDESLAVDLIRERGIGGHFLDTDHTVANFREEIFLPALSDRTAEDVVDMVASAHDEVERILSRTPVFSRDESLCREIDALYDAELARRQSPEF
jgi:trimethylamine---corrinoid protein Co-methyltransferase